MELATEKEKKKAKHWQKCRMLNICFPQHPKTYKISIVFYFQSHCKHSICLSRGILNWNDDSLHFSHYTTGHPDRIWNIWAKFTCNEVYEGVIITFLASLQLFLIQARPEKPFKAFVETDISMKTFVFIWLAVYNWRSTIKKVSS